MSTSARRRLMRDFKVRIPLPLGYLAIIATFFCFSRVSPSAAVSVLGSEFFFLLLPFQGSPVFPC